MFCKFHDAEGNAAYVRPSSVQAFLPSRNFGGCTVIYLECGEEVVVKETVAEVKKQVDCFFTLNLEKP